MVNTVWRIIILFLYIILGVSFQNHLGETQTLIFVLGFFAIFAWVCTGALAENFPNKSKNKLNSRKE